MSDNEVEGPALPPHMIEAAQKAKQSERERPSTVEPPPKRRRVMGPCFSDLVAEEKIEQEQEDIIGPPPPGMLNNDSNNNETTDDIDDQWNTVLNSAKNQEKQVQKREDWMLSLPDGPSMLQFLITIGNINYSIKGNKEFKIKIKKHLQKMKLEILTILGHKLQMDHLPLPKVQQLNQRNLREY